MIHRILLTRNNLNNLKSKVDQLDRGKLETTPVHLSKLSNVVKNYVVKRNEYDELVKKVNAIPTTETSDLVDKIQAKLTNHDHDK